MHIKLNFNNFIFYGVCLPQLGSTPAAYAVVAGGYDRPIHYLVMTSFRYVRYVRYVPYVSSVTLFMLRALRWMETPLNSMPAAFVVIKP